MNIRKITAEGVAKTLRPNQALRNGQIIQGEIVKLYPNQKAQIKLGNQQLIAKLEASLMIGGKYHFQVKTSDSILYLQVIGEKMRNKPKQDLSDLLRQLGLKTTKSNVHFMQKLISEGTAFSKAQITAALPLLDDVKDKNQAGEVLQEMISRKIPITDSIFKALYTHKTNGQSDLIHQLLLHIKNDPKYTMLEQQLSKLVTQDKPFQLSSPKDQFLQHLSQILRLMDTSYENTASKQETMKNMLIQLVSNSSGMQKELGEKLLQFIQGIQLSAVSETDNFIQASIQIPAEKLGLHKDLELQFESKKTENGKINPDFCRILFYLDLKNLNETIIDMNIRQRSIFIAIYNEYETLKTKTLPFEPSLKKGLKELNYHLASIQFKLLNERKEQKNPSTKPGGIASYQGVDFRI